MDPDILKKLEELEKKINDTYRSVERMRKYLEWTFIIGIAVIVLPLIGLAFVVPSFIKTLSIGGIGL